MVAYLHWTQALDTCIQQQHAKPTGPGTQRNRPDLRQTSAFKVDHLVDCGY